MLFHVFQKIIAHQKNMRVSPVYKKDARLKLRVIDLLIRTLPMAKMVNRKGNMCSRVEMVSLVYTEVVFLPEKRRIFGPRGNNGSRSLGMCLYTVTEEFFSRGLK